jgi:hypothetical protein
MMRHSVSDGGGVARQAQRRILKRHCPGFRPAVARHAHGTVELLRGEGAAGGAGRQGAPAATAGGASTGRSPTNAASAWPISDGKLPNTATATSGKNHTM